MISDKNIAIIKWFLYTILIFILIHNAYINTGYEGGWNLFVERMISGGELYNDIEYLLPPLYPFILKITYFREYETTILFVIHFFIYGLMILFYRKNINKIMTNSHVTILSTILIGYLPLLFGPFRLVDYHIFSILCVSICIYSVLVNKYGLSYFACAIVALIRPHDGVAIFFGLVCANILLEKITLRTLLIFIFPVTVYFIYFFLGYEFLEPYNNGFESVKEAKGISIYHLAVRILMGLVSPLYYIIKSNDLVIIFASVAAILYSRLDVVRIFAFGVAAFLLLRNHEHIALIFYIFTLFYFVKNLYYRITSNPRSDLIGLALSIVVLSYYCSSFLSSAGRSSGFGMQSLGAFFIMLYALSKTDFKHPVINYINTRYLLISFIFIIICAKLTLPFEWHLYRSSPLMTNITLYNGKFLKKDLALVYEKICPELGKKSVLSLPFSNINYVCNLPLFENNINNFFDITSNTHYGKLIDQLEDSPPEYIFYTRQYSNMIMHERLFNEGRMMPFRNLDNFIINRIESGNWNARCVAVVSNGYFDQDACFDLSNQFKIDRKKDVIYLIKTR